MFAHIWEIKDIRASYFFFTDNCSYEMLWLIEAARPEVDLRKHFIFDVIPLETVHVAKEENLLLRSNYRPSKHSKIEAYRNVLDDRAIKFAKKLAGGAVLTPEIVQLSEFSLNTQRYILEVAIELSQYYYQRQKLSKERYLDIFHALTTQRATLGRTKTISPTKPPDPLNGHRAARSTVSPAYINNKPAVLFGIRPAYHDLSDPLYGFLRGTQIEFLNMEAYASSKDLKLQKATILSIESIAQVDAFFHNFSWRTHLGWERE